MAKELEEEAAAPSEGGGPRVYMVSQGIVFMKHSEDPSSRRILRSKRPVGSTIFSTGSQWRGPQGGLWAEVDTPRSPGERGWVLIEGPGFGVQGPLLVDPSVEDAATQRICIRWLKDPPIFDCLVSKTATIGDLVGVFCAQTGLNRKETIFTKGLPAPVPTGTGDLLPLDYTAAKDVLNNEMKVGEAGIAETLNLVYLGHFDEDYRKPM